MTKQSTQLLAGCASGCFAAVMLAAYVPIFFAGSCHAPQFIEAPVASTPVRPPPRPVRAHEERQASTEARVIVPAQRETPVEPPQTSVEQRDPHKRRIAIVLCRFRDRPLDTRPPQWYVDYLTRRGTGGQADYWYDVTFGAIDLSESKVFGWYTMAHDSSEVRQLVFPGGRTTLVAWGRETAQANGVDLSQFDGLIVVQNWGIDHGAAGGGVVFVDADRNAIEPTFWSHEMGHLFGLPHSFGERGVAPCISSTGVYCDAWDIMSAMNVFSFDGSYQGLRGTTGPGLNVFAARALGALPPERMRRLTAAQYDERIAISPLNQQLQNGMIYDIEIPPFTIEYRVKRGWDAGLPSDAILVHAERNGVSYLELTPNNAGLHAGDQYFTNGPRIEIDVESIDPILQRAVVHVVRR